MFTIYNAGYTIQDSRKISQANVFGIWYIIYMTIVHGARFTMYNTKYVVCNQNFQHKVLSTEIICYTVLHGVWLIIQNGRESVKDSNYTKQRLQYKHHKINKSLFG